MIQLVILMCICLVTDTTMLIYMIIIRIGMGPKFLFSPSIVCLFYILCLFFLENRPEQKNEIEGTQPTLNNHWHSSDLHRLY